MTSTNHTMKGKLGLTLFTLSTLFETSQLFTLLLLLMKCPSAPFCNLLLLQYNCIASSTTPLQFTGLGPMSWRSFPSSVRVEARCRFPPVDLDIWLHRQAMDRVAKEGAGWWWSCGTLTLGARWGTSPGLAVLESWSSFCIALFYIWHITNNP